MSLPWTCPACGTGIRHRDDPLGQRMTYRCAVCRLELVADIVSGSMTVAPLPPDSPQPTRSGKVAPVPTEPTARRPARKKELTKPHITH
jgi:hypothetical protein